MRLNEAFGDGTCVEHGGGLRRLVYDALGSGDRTRTRWAHLRAPKNTWSIVEQEEVWVLTYEYVEDEISWQMPQIDGAATSTY